MRRALSASLVAAASLAPAGSGALAIEKAELVKAAMVEKISRFIEWPGPMPARFALCISQEHPQLAAVKAYYENVSIGDRPVDVTVVKRGEALGGCRVAFLAPRELADLARVRPQAERERVLLVAEGVEAARSGVHVGFYSDMNKLRLEVNRKALEASGLKASYRLLEVSKVVE